MNYMDKIKACDIYIFILYLAGLQQAFRPFGALSIEWPGKDGKHSRHPPKGL